VIVRLGDVWMPSGLVNYIVAAAFSIDAVRVWRKHHGGRGWRDVRLLFWGDLSVVAINIVLGVSLELI
jgi:hypothetical protein